MLYTVSSVGRNVLSIPKPPVTLSAGVAKDVVADSLSSVDEIESITLYNVGSNAAFFNYGADCDGTNNYVGNIAAGGNVSIKSRERISCFSTSGTTIGVLVLKRENTVVNRINYV